MTSRLAWITGARGFIGRHLARQLAAEGVVVAGVGHGAWPDAAAWGVTRWINGEPDSANLAQLAFETGLPDTVFHLAGGSSVAIAIQSPYEDFTRTVLTTARLLDWLKREAPTARFVAVSSAAVYGDGHAGPIPETALPQPFSPYGAHKLMMEQLARSYAVNFGLPVVIARLFSVYGPHLRKQLLWDVCQRLSAGERHIELGGTGRERRDWTEVHDVARALSQLAALASPAAPVINVGTGVGTDVATIANHVLSAWQGDTRPTIGFSGRSRPGDPASLVAGDTGLAELGFVWATGVRHGIESYVRWFQSQRQAGE
jgi:UDP-glucose 4-epimerase